MMLFTQCVATIHKLSDTKPQEVLKSKAMRERVPIVIVQILSRILSTQNSDGTWGLRGHTEPTVNAVLALRDSTALPYTQILRTEIHFAIEKAREGLFLRQHVVSEPDPFMVSNIGYRTYELSEAYALAAKKIISDEKHPSRYHEVPASKQAHKLLQFAAYFSGLNHLQKEPFAQIKTAILEASLYQPFLKTARTDVFPRTTAKEQDKYLEYIPMMWVLACRSYSVFLSSEYLLDMMILSMWIFLTDEYMESKVAKLPDADVLILRRHVENLYLEEAAGYPEDSCIEHNLSHQVLEAMSVFNTFAQVVIHYPRVINASEADRLDLRVETKNYLLHHLSQLEDNIRLTRQAPPESLSTMIKFLSPRTSFQTWVHTVGAGHVSGPFSYSFFACCIGSSLRSGSDCFSSPKQKLMAHGMNAHYGAFCRLYNDYGSVGRDAKEGNLNSLNFPDFFSTKSHDRDPDVSADEQVKLGRAKKLLLDAARYERDCALSSADMLYKELEAEGEVGKKLADRIRCYIGAGEQFSDLYLTRDVTNTVK